MTGSSRFKFSFSQKEKEIISEYEKSLCSDTSGKTKISYAKRILAITEPDAIILGSPEMWVDVLFEQGLINPGVSVSKSRCKAIYYVRCFMEYLKKVFDAGLHLNDWFEPEFQYEKAKSV